MLLHTLYIYIGEIGIFEVAIFSLVNYVFRVPKDLQMNYMVKVALRFRSDLVELIETNRRREPRLR